MDVSLIRVLRRKAKSVARVLACCALVAPAVWLFIFPMTGNAATGITGIATFVLFVSLLSLFTNFRFFSDIPRIFKIDFSYIPNDFDESMNLVRSLTGRAFGIELVVSLITVLLAGAMATFPEFYPVTSPALAFWLKAAGLMFLGTALPFFWLFLGMQSLALAPRFWVKVMWVNQSRKNA